MEQADGGDACEEANEPGERDQSQVMLTTKTRHNAKHVWSRAARMRRPDGRFVLVLPAGDE
jgi:hypothetical protein